MNKFCKDCAHFPKYGSMQDAMSITRPICGHSMKSPLPDESDLVFGGSGKTIFRFCDDCRADETDCGKKAKFFKVQRLWHYIPIVK